MVWSETGNHQQSQKGDFFPCASEEGIIRGGSCCLGQRTQEQLCQEAVCVSCESISKKHKPSKKTKRKTTCSSVKHSVATVAKSTEMYVQSVMGKGHGKSTYQEMVAAKRLGNKTFLDTRVLLVKDTMT